MTEAKKLNEAKRMEMQELVTELLEKTGHSRVSLAEELGVSVGAIGRYRSGDSMGTNAQRAALRAICEASGLKVEPLDYWVRLAGKLAVERAAPYGGAEKLEPEALEEALRGHDAKACLCSGCALRRDRPKSARQEKDEAVAKSMALGESLPEAPTREQVEALDQALVKADAAIVRFAKEGDGPADAKARDLARQYLALLDENVEELYSGRASYEAFSGLNRVIWDTVQNKSSPAVKEALLEMLRARRGVTVEGVAHG